MAAPLASNGKTVLLVDDDSDIRETLATTLAREGYVVVKAKDGREAIAMLVQHRPDAILSDIRMPNIDGLTLLDHIRKSSQIPFVLMTGFSEILKTKDAQDRGATDFILKPFKREEVLATLDVVINSDSRSVGASSMTSNTDEEDLDLNFCRLSIDEFVSGKMSLADIFVRITAKRYIQVARQNSELSIDRIQAYKSKGLHFLYIRKEDFARYIGLNVELTKKVMTKKSVSKSQRLRLLKHTGEILLQDAYVNGVSKEKLQASAALVEAMVSTLSEDAELFELLDILQTHADYLYAHSLGVALYASLIAKEVGWTATPTLFKITMGGLLHDIGKKEIERSILEKPRQQLTLQERTMYETHPIRGKELLTLIKSVPEDVAQISMHHHENITGRGFPYRLLKSKIHPLAKLISVVDEFCLLVLKSPGMPEPISAQDALGRIYSLKREELDMSFLRALMQLFDYPIPLDMPVSSLPKLN
ncbi:MAG: response regulator [Bdellovibrionales bacterium]